MSETSEVETLFKNFYTMIENQFQQKIGILYTDNSTDYFVEILGDFLKHMGSQHQSTCIDTLQQTGLLKETTNIY